MKKNEYLLLLALALVLALMVGTLYYVNSKNQKEAVAVSVFL